MDDKKKLTNDELETVSGGVGGGAGYYMTVGYCGSYLALRPEPCWDKYHELARLLPGCQVFTYGETKRGTGPQGHECTYRFVRYEGCWGYADAAYLS